MKKKCRSGGGGGGAAGGGGVCLAISIGLRYSYYYRMFQTIKEFRRPTNSVHAEK